MKPIYYPLLIMLALFKSANAFSQDASNDKAMKTRWNKYGDAYLSVLSSEQRSMVLKSAFANRYKEQEEKFQAKIKRTHHLSNAARDSILISKVNSSGPYRLEEYGDRLPVKEAKVNNDLFKNRKLSERDTEVLEIFNGKDVYIVTSNKTKKGETWKDREVMVLKNTMDVIWAVNYLRAR